MRRLVPLIVVLCAMAVFFVLYLYTTASRPGFDPICDHASFRTNEWGTQAVRELLGALGLKTVTWSRPWTELRDDTRALWIINPLRESSAAEVRALLRWVHRGGWLVVAPDPRSEARGLSLGNRQADEALLGRLGWRSSPTQKEDVTVPVAVRDPVLRDVKSVRVPAPWRLKEKVSPWGVGDESERRNSGNSQEPRRMLRAACEVLIQDGGGVVVARLRHGKGVVILLCDADMLSNKPIREADNGVLAANLAFGAEGNAVWFDEYHHGQRAEAKESLDRGAVGRTIWAAVISLALFYLSKFWRFGAPLPAAPEPRRSSLEYVRAFATLYQQAGQGRAALELIGERFRSRLALAAGVGAGASSAALARAVAQRYPRVEEHRLAALLDGLDATTRADRGPSHALLLELTQTIARIEQELLYHER